MKVDRRGFVWKKVEGSGSETRGLRDDYDQNNTYMYGNATSYRINIHLSKPFKKPGGVAQLVKCCPRVCKALDSIPSTTETKHDSSHLALKRWKQKD